MSSRMSMGQLNHSCSRTVLRFGMETAHSYSWRERRRSNYLLYLIQEHSRWRRDKSNRGQPGYLQSGSLAPLDGLHWAPAIQRSGKRGMTLGTTHPFWCLELVSLLVELPDSDYGVQILNSCLTLGHTSRTCLCLNPVSPEPGQWCLYLALLLFCLGLRTIPALWIHAGVIQKLSWELFFFLRWGGGCLVTGLGIFWRRLLERLGKPQ